MQSMASVRIYFSGCITPSVVYDGDIDIDIQENRTVVVTEVASAIPVIGDGPFDEDTVSEEVVIAVYNANEWTHILVDNDD